MTDKTKAPAKTTLATSVASYNSIKTSLVPVAYGKRQQRQANLKAKMTVQLFKDSEKVIRYIATLANNGTVSFYSLQLMRLANSLTNNASLAQRPVFVSTALDPREYPTRDNRIVYGDSNPQMVENFNASNSPYNSAIINGNVGTMLIPFTSKNDDKDLVWDNNKHNQHVALLAKRLEIISNTNTTESKKSEAFTKAWNEYQATELEMKEAGIIVPNSVIVAQDNGFVPGVTLHQTLVNNNQFFNGSKVFSNEDSRATYCPLINTISGIFEVTDTASDPKTEWTYGLNSTNSNPNSSAESTGIKRCSSEVIAYDFLNKKSAEPMRIVVSDLLTTNSNTSRAQTFLNFTEENSMVQVTEATLSLGYALGGYTSIFSLEGNDISYTSYKNTTASSIGEATALDLDKEVSIAKDDSIGTVGDINFNMDDFLAETVDTKTVSKDVVTESLVSEEEF